MVGTLGLVGLLGQFLLELVDLVLLGLLDLRDFILNKFLIGLVLNVLTHLFRICSFDGIEIFQNLLDLIGIGLVPHLLGQLIISIFLAVVILLFQLLGKCLVEVGPQISNLLFDSVIQLSIIISGLLLFEFGHIR